VLHCDLANAKVTTDLFIQQPGDDQRHDHSFAKSECRVAVPEFLHLRLPDECKPASFQGLLDARQQYVVIEGWVRLKRRNGFTSGTPLYI
jgi:hypothetical protein